MSEKKSKKIKSIEIDLSEPIQMGDELIETLKLRRPRAKDLKDLSATPSFQDLLKVGQKCAAVPNIVMDKLDGEDAMLVVEAVGDFLDSGQKTGIRRLY